MGPLDRIRAVQAFTDFDRLKGVAVVSLVAVLGLIIGSFLNVCIYRLPERRSIAWPRSSCPHCGRRLAPRDLVPVLSYLRLGGRCRYCREPISPHYPIVDLATGMFFAAVVAVYCISLVSLKYLILFRSS